jgi:hypothetical protein
MRFEVPDEMGNLECGRGGNRVGACYQDPPFAGIKWEGRRRIARRQEVRSDYMGSLDCAR